MMIGACCVCAHNLASKARIWHTFAILIGIRPRLRHGNGTWRRGMMVGGGGWWFRVPACAWCWAFLGLEDLAPEALSWQVHGALAYDHGCVTAVGRGDVGQWLAIVYVGFECRHACGVVP
jgi:hypothetical protein